MPVLINVTVKCDNCGEVQASSLQAGKGPSGLDREPLKGWTLGTDPRNPAAYCPACAGVACDHLGGLVDGRLSYEVVE